MREASSAYHQRRYSWNVCVVNRTLKCVVGVDATVLVYDTMPWQFMGRPRNGALKGHMSGEEEEERVSQGVLCLLYTLEIDIQEEVQEGGP